MKMFLRVNAEMANMFLTDIVKVELPTGDRPRHYAVWKCYASAAIKQFLAAQSQDCQSWHHSGKFVHVGVSLSSMDSEIADILSKRPDVTRVVTHACHPNMVEIKNRSYGYGEWYGWCPLVAPVSSISPVEQQFRDLAGKTDLYYQYSDSIHVWRAGEARHKALMEEGKALGLSRDQMDRIIRSMMAK